MRKTRFTEAQIMGVLRQAEGGLAVPELCREHGISSATCLTNGGRSMAAWICSDAKCLKALEDEDAKLKKLLVG